ncbi:hypothetical protein PYW08_003194 [Mythimna loreyi]|uniref:Uncharacterized protein n=1 Tax=Mythimna loreyi TaxID=667449 RepID=A0ACC2QRH7_9NEOP|nr:hypothetical protein PYW08_003194 [Mythimna loreyi]
MMKSTDPDDVPAFVAKDLHKLPPVTFDHVDVTRLLKDITALKASLAEVQSKLEMSNTTVGDLRAEVELLRNAVSESRAPNNSSVNIRRKARNASIGIFESASCSASPAADNVCVASCSAAAVAVSSPGEVVTRVCTSTPKRAYSAIVAANKPAVSQTMRQAGTTEGGKQSDEDGFTKVEKKKKKKPSCQNQCGTALAGPNMLLRPAIPTTQLYISRLHHTTKVEDIVSYKSSMLNITAGVPQGSILGPLLFILFTNDLINYFNKILPDIKLIVFADDTNAIVSANDIKTLNDAVNAALAVFHSWFSANKLVINAKKTNIMLFKTTARNKDTGTMDIELNKVKVELVREVKFLGIYIDDLLNWKRELVALDSSISSACYALRTLRDEVSLEALKLVYYALIESRLQYSIQFWGNSYNYNFQRAFILQKRAIRTIVRIPQQESCRPFFKELGILTVPGLYILVLLSTFKKYIHYFENDEDRLVREKTRRKDLDNILIPSLNIVKHSPLYQAVNIFNKLPLDLKSILYTKSFKERLKSFLLEKCLYSLNEL